MNAIRAALKAARYLGGRCLSKVRGSLLTDGEDELDEREVERCFRTSLRLRPQHAFSITQRKVGCRHGGTEVHFPKNVRTIEHTKPVNGNPVLQLLLQNGWRIEDGSLRTRQSICRSAHQSFSFVAAGAGRQPYRLDGALGDRARDALGDRALPAASCAATKETIGGRKNEAKRNACPVVLPRRRPWRAHERKSRQGHARRYRTACVTSSNSVLSLYISYN